MLKEWVWLCANKALFINISAGPDLARGLQVGQGTQHNVSLGQVFLRSCPFKGWIHLNVIYLEISYLTGLCLVYL